jgi:hypothetical protein
LDAVHYGTHLMNTICIKYNNVWKSTGCLSSFLSSHDCRPRSIHTCI